MSDIEAISRPQFETYMLLVETALPMDVVAKKLGLSVDGANDRQRKLFELLGVSSRLALMTQYHHRERYGCR